LGILGALGFGFAAMMAWFFLIKLTGYEIGYAAWGVGLLTGLGARWLGRQTSVLLGLWAGACALAAILGGQFLATYGLFEEQIGKIVDQAYAARMDYARDALKIDASSDDQVMQFLSSHAEKGEMPTPASIAEFRDRDLATMKDFVAGKPSQAQFRAQQTQKFLSIPRMRWIMIKDSVSLFTLLWLFLGVGSAYKLAAGEKD